MENRVVSVNMDKIIELANEKGFSLTGLESELNIGHGLILRWKRNGGGVANINTLYRLARYFGVTVDDLLEKVN